MLHASRFLFCVLCALTARAQTNRYMVFFKDKTNTPYSITQPQSFLSAKAITRRNHSGISVTVEDLPVSPVYVAQVKATGAKVFFTSRWFNGVLVEATPSLMNAITTLPMVSKVEYVAPGHQLAGGRMAIQSATASTTATDYGSLPQFEMAGIDVMQEEDQIRGKGIMISVIDAGFPGIDNGLLAFSPVVNEGRILMTRDFVGNSGNVYQYDNHGTVVFSVIGAKQGTWQCKNNCGAYSYVGAAPEAYFNLFVTEDVSSEYHIEEYNWAFAAEQADSAGTDVINSSLTYATFDDPSMNYKTSDLDGKTAVISRAAAIARDRGIVVVSSAGNDGLKAWHYIRFPSDVDGILTVGEVNVLGFRGALSSFGPTADGRIKPDVMAMGVNSTAILPNGEPTLFSGTSLAAPIISGIAAGLIQAFPELKPADIVAIIKASASQSRNPDNEYGYGIASYVAARNYLQNKEVSTDASVYPNPFKDNYHVIFKDLPDGAVSLSLFDMAGRAVTEHSLSLIWSQNPLEIYAKNLLPGSYILKVVAGGKTYTLRLMKV